GRKGGGNADGLPPLRSPELRRVREKRCDPGRQGRDSFVFERVDQAVQGRLEARSREEQPRGAVGGTAARHLRKGGVAVKAAEAERHAGAVHERVAGGTDLAISRRRSAAGGAAAIEERVGEVARRRSNHVSDHSPPPPRLSRFSESLPHCSDRWLLAGPELERRRTLLNQ